MAFASVGTLGATANKTAGASVVHTTTAAAAAGSLVVVIVAKDPDASSGGGAVTSEVSGVTDSAGNTYSKAHEWSNASGSASGVVCSVWFCVLATALSSGGTITAGFASRTAKAISAWNYSVGSGSGVAVDGTPTTSSATTGTTSISGLSNVQHLLVNAWAVEGTSALVPSSTSGYTTMSGATTTGGGSASNVFVRGTFNIATGTSSSDAGSNYGYTAGLPARILVAFKEVASGPVNANASGALAGVTITAQGGGATGGSAPVNANASGALAVVAATPPAFTSSGGTGIATGAALQVVSTAGTPALTASAGASRSSALPGIIVTAHGLSASAAAAASGALSNVTITGPGATATGGAGGVGKPLPQVGAKVPAAFTDEFDGTQGQALTARPGWGGGYIGCTASGYFINSGGWVSRAGSTMSNLSAVFRDDDGATDQWVEANAPAGYYEALFVFADTVGGDLSGYSLHANAGRWHLTRIVDGVITLNTFIGTFVHGTTPGLRAYLKDASTTRVEVYDNGTLLLTFDDTAANRRTGGLRGLGATDVNGDAFAMFYNFHDRTGGKAATASGTSGTNATAALPTVTVTAPGASVSAGASLAPVFANVLASSLAAAAGGGVSGLASATLPSVTLSSLTATAQGAANRSAALAGVAITAPGAIGTGGVAGGATGPLSSILATPAGIGGTGTASRSAALPSSVVSTMTATAAAGAAGNASAALPGCTITPAGAAASAGAGVAPVFANVLASPPAISAGGGVTGAASAALPGLSITTPTASVNATASTGAGLAVTTLSSLTATAGGAQSANATAALPSTAISSPGATGAGGVGVAGPFANVVTTTPAISAGGGTAGLASGALPQVTIAAPSSIATGTASTSAALPSTSAVAPAVAGAGSAAVTVIFASVDLTASEGTGAGAVPTPTPPERTIALPGDQHLLALLGIRGRDSILTGAGSRELELEQASRTANLSAPDLTMRLLELA